MFLCKKTGLSKLSWVFIKNQTWVWQTYPKLPRYIWKYNCPDLFLVYRVSGQPTEKGLNIWL